MSIVQSMILPLEGEIRTFAKDKALPPLPVPPLKRTLQKYLDSILPFVSPEQFSKTEKIVLNFEKGIGKKLQEKLENLAHQSCNWVEKWWEEKAYLEIRTPLMPFCNMVGLAPMENVWDFLPGSMVEHASLYMYYVMKMWQLLRSELFTPTRSADGTTFSMNQFRRLYNCSRIPLPERDRLDIHFKTAKEGYCPSHVIVMCNGWIYSVETFADESGRALTPPEWEKQLHYILMESSKHKGPGLGRLTCDDRDTWAKNRERLISWSGENAHNLHIVESAVCVLTLEPDIEPKSPSEIIMHYLSGNYENIWADKSTGILFFGNGCNTGTADHTAFDGTISIASSYFTYYSLLETNGKWTESNATRSLSPPMCLTFFEDITIRNELEQATVRLNKSKTQVVAIYETFHSFGKALPVKYRIHPDTFVQMALQLAYYRMHKRPAPCYETATTRSYYNGRTETVRSCTLEMIEWVQAMLKAGLKVQEKLTLMRKAAKKHDHLMQEGRENGGCDRHLFGLYCIALENGIPIPELYQDPSYFLSGGGGNFILSTSLLGYTPIGGGVAPMTKDGYGVFYNISPDRLTFTISVMRESSSTSATKFYRNVCHSLYDMKVLLESDQMFNKAQAHL